MDNVPTVGDLFCGAGGFSEGFRQAGFRIRWAVDNWSPATTTFEKNFPGAKVRNANVLEMDLSELEPVDVLIGGPPCTFFSLANRGGGGDTEKGLELVSRFLEAVKVLKPKYWVMENVPNLRNVIEKLENDEASRSTLNRDHFLKMELIKGEWFGLPQRRHRLFSGKFPTPSSPLASSVPMSKVIMGLPYPLGTLRSSDTVTDPIYDWFNIPASKLTDQMMDTRLSKDELEDCRNQKLNNRIYGKMRFPDDLSLPSRTIGATATKSVRSTIVIKDPHGVDVFRTPTLRECASLQGFPITFQFWDGHPTERQRLIGNAVPPPIAKAIALEIRREMGLPEAERPSFMILDESPPNVNSSPRRQNKYRLRRTFRRFVPGTTHYRRVELDNLGASPSLYPAGTSQHLVEWRCVLYLGYAKDYMSFKLDLPTSIRISALALSDSTDGHPSQRTTKNIEKVVKLALDEFADIPDASTLQAIWARRMSRKSGPEWILKKTAGIAKNLLDSSDFIESGVSAKSLVSLLKEKELAWGKESSEGKWMRETIDAYTALVSVVLCVAVALANDGSTWLKSNWGKRYAANPSHLATSRPTGLSGLTRNRILAIARNEIHDSS